MKGLDSELQDLFAKVKQLEKEKAKRIIGQEKELKAILICLFSWGLDTNFHILFESVPGLGKTILVKTVGSGLGIKFARIQMTAELLPSDISGYEKINPRSGEIIGVKHGPIFTNLLLVDEINRASEKTQSALLEAMQEGQVTIGDQSFVLEKPFLLMATQNPLEHIGTRPLGAAQLDRFLMKVNIDYPSFEEEERVVKLHGRPLGEEIKLAMNREEILRLKELIRDSVYLDEAVISYIAKLVRSTRPGETGDPQVKEKIKAGASPRASIYLAATSKVFAFLAGRDYVLPEDIEEMAYLILPHRVVSNPGYSEKDINDLIGQLILKAGQDGEQPNAAKGN